MNLQRSLIVSVCSATYDAMMSDRRTHRCGEYCDDHASTLPEVPAAEEAHVIEIDAKVASACGHRGSQPHLLATRMLSTPR